MDDRNKPINVFCTVSFDFRGKRYVVAASDEAPLYAAIYLQSTESDDKLLIGEAQFMEDGGVEMMGAKGHPLAAIGQHCFGAIAALPVALHAASQRVPCRAVNMADMNIDIRTMAGAKPENDNGE